LVAIDLRDADTLTAALTHMQASAQKIGARNYSWLVQEFVSDGIEVFVGVSRDLHFGLSISFGMGGVGIEILKDFTLRMLPLREGEARNMLADVRGAALFSAYRNKPAADVNALVDCIEKLAAFAWAHRDQINEIDLNPIKLRSEGHGCVIVDALITTR
jgi:acetyltransferase